MSHEKPRRWVWHQVWHEPEDGVGEKMGESVGEKGGKPNKLPKAKGYISHKLNLTAGL